MWTHMFPIFLLQILSGFPVFSVAWGVRHKKGELVVGHKLKRNSWFHHRTYRTYGLCYCNAFLVSCTFLNLVCWEMLIEGLLILKVSWSLFMIYFAYKKQLVLIMSSIEFLWYRSYHLVLATVLEWFHVCIFVTTWNLGFWYVYPLGMIDMSHISELLQNTSCTRIIRNFVSSLTTQFQF